MKKLKILKSLDPQFFTKESMYSYFIWIQLTKYLLNTEWPVSEQDKVRQNSQTENDGKKDRIRGDTRWLLR